MTLDGRSSETHWRISAGHTFRIETKNLRTFWCFNINWHNTQLLTGTIFHLKKVHFEPSGMNHPINKERRLQYVSNLNAYIQDGKTIIWLDETNLNLHILSPDAREVIVRPTMQYRATKLQRPQHPRHWPYFVFSSNSMDSTTRCFQND